MSLFIDDEGGFTSVGVLIATMLVCALLFSAAQVSWVESNAADIQDVADAGALAADNIVAEYMVVARVTDAIVLSMSLLGLTLYAVGAVAACIPVADAAAEPVLSLARQVMDARQKFAKSAIESLEKLQRAIPFLCVVSASRTAAANSCISDVSASYGAIAIAVPLEPEEATIPDDESTADAADTVEKNSDEASESSKEAKDALDEVNEAKQEGYAADCGAGTSMQERASALAGMTGAQNPCYASADFWGFDIALERAKAYYSARLAAEAPEYGGIEELTRSIARKRFYRFALEVLADGYVESDSEGTITAYLPFLPEDTEDVRSTPLYTESIWPVSIENGVLTIHATADCPGCKTPAGTAAVCDIDSGTVMKCPICDFSASTLGHAPSASTSIDNGFEHYYRSCARAAQRYSEASKRYADASKKAKELTQDSMDAFGKALGELGKHRFNPKPPGRFGCVCVAYDTSSHSAPDVLAAFVGGVATIGPRAAISGAMLAPDDPQEGANVISSLLDGVEAQGALGDAAGLASGAVGLWGDLLFAYSNGTAALKDGVKKMFAEMPLIGSDELSRWAEKTLEDTIDLVGLQPVKMESLKPVLVNTADVLKADPSGAGAAILQAKEAYVSYPGSGSGTVLGSMLDGAAAVIAGREDDLDEGTTIAHVSLFEGGPSFDVRFKLPEAISQARAQLGAWLSDCSRVLDAAITGDDVAWA